MKKNILQIKKGIFSFVLLALPFFGYSITTFDKTTKFGGNQSPWAYVLMDDGGYVVTGYTRDAGSPDTNLLVRRYTAIGEPVWTKSIGGSKADFGYYIIKSSDGNLVVTGSTANNSIGSDDFFLLKMDYSGNVVWQKTFGTANSDVARSLCETKDGGFCMGGYTMTSAVNEDAYIVKTDKDGVQQWAKLFGGPGDDHFYSIRQNADESYILTGASGSNPVPNRNLDLYLVKLTKTGDMIWQKYFGGANFDEGKFVNLTPDGQYIICGSIAPNPSDDDAYILKTDTSGVKLWDNSFGQTDKDLARSIENTSDGGFIIGGITRSYGLVNPQMWLIKTDHAGKFQWHKFFGGTEHEHCYQAKPTADGGYLLVGHSNSFSGGSNVNVYMVKTDMTGAVTGIGENNNISGIAVFPNPATTHVNVQLTNTNAGEFTIKLVNILGAEIYSHKEFISEGSSTKEISFAGLNAAPGLYFLEIQSGNFVKTEKIIVR